MEMYRLTRTQQIFLISITLVVIILFAIAFFIVVDTNGDIAVMTQQAINQEIIGD